MKFKRLIEEQNRLECLKNKEELTDYGLEMLTELNQALQLLQTDVSSCNCKIPEPIGKCSENGVVSYCKKCLKNYSN